MRLSIALMTTNRPRSGRPAKNKITIMTEENIAGRKEGGDVGEALGKALERINEMNHEMRRMDKKETDDSIKMLAEKLEALQVAHI